MPAPQPTYQDIGPVLSDVGPITVPYPPHITNDVALLWVETANQAATLSTPAGFVEVTNQGTGTAGAVGSTRLTLFWNRATSSAMASPVVADSGDHQLAFITTFRNCITTGNPWDVISGGVQTPATKNISIPGATTTLINTLVVIGLANGGPNTQPQVTSVTSSGLSGLTKRKNTQPEGTGAPILRVGIFGLENHVGEGPGGVNPTNPWRVGVWNPHAEGLSNVPAAIAAADAADIVLLAFTPGGLNNWKTNGAFDMAKYQARLDLLVAIPEFNDAITRGRVHAYIADEPNISSWNGTFTPTQVNNCAIEHKNRWPGCLTFVRCRPSTLTTGWSGKSPPAGGYTALDYGWLQLNSAWRIGGNTVAQEIAAEKTAAAGLDIGVSYGLNLMNAGLRTNFDTVTACWDHDLNGGTETGIIIGDVPGPGFVDRQYIPCSQVGTVPNGQHLLANPDLIRRVAAVGALDTHVPYLVLWAYPDAASGSDGVDLYWFRSDGIQAFTDAIASGVARTNWDGLRVAKGPPF